MLTTRYTILASSFYILGIIAFFCSHSIIYAFVLLIILLFFNYRNYISSKFCIVLYLLFIFAVLNCSFRIKNFNDLSFYIPADGEILGTVVSKPTTNSLEKTKFYFVVDSIKLGSGIINTKNSKTVVTLHDSQENYEKIKIGDRLKLNGKLRKPIQAKNPSQFDYSKYLKHRDVFSVFYATTNYKVLGQSDKFKFKFLRQLSDKRDSILKIHSQFLKSPNIEVLGGIVFGDDAINPPDEIKNSFINSGLLHILAASGMNVSIIFAIWYFIARRLRLNFRLNIFIGAVLVAVYTFMTGLGPSVLRASLMIEFVLLGKLIDRAADNIALIFFVAFLMLVYNPAMIFDVGFQLSFVVTFGLVYYSEFLFGKVENKVLNTVLGIVSIPVVAQLWAFPIQMFYFNTFSTYSILANILITPFIFVISSLGFASSILALIPIDAFADFVCKISDYVLNPVISGLVNISYYFSNLPNSLVTTIHPDNVQIILYYSILLFIGYLIRKQLFSRRVLAILSFVIIAFFMSFIKLPNRDCEILFFDVGNADCFLIKTPKNKYIMIDTAKGHVTKSFSQTDAIINKYLKDKGINELELLLVTHFDVDHSGGVIDVLNAVKVKNIVLNKNKDDFKTTLAIENYIKDNKLNYTYAKNKDAVYKEENLNLVLYTPEFSKRTNDNDSSIVSVLSYKNFDILFMADGGIKTFESIKKDLYLKDNSFEVIKVGHHGARGVVSNQMLKDLGVDVSIISTGLNYFGHPDKETIEILKNRGVHIFRTDVNNALLLRTDGIIYKILYFNTLKNRFENVFEAVCDK